MASVDFVRQELADRFTDYRKIDDCIEGQSAIKARGEVYLPKPNAEVERANSSRLKKRYEGYISRAVFVNYCSKTLEGLTGMVFDKSPQITLPPRCSVIEKNADGSGVNLEQLTKNLVSLIVKKGRSGVFIDYPETKGPVSVYDLEVGNIRPSILVYNPESIINWDEGSKGSKTYNTLIVFKEKFSHRAKGDFETKKLDQWRVLELIDSNGNREGETLSDNPIYRVTLWRKASDWIGNAVVALNGPAPATGSVVAPEGWSTVDGGWLTKSTIPVDGAGKTLSEIPFTFVGAISNSSSVDKPPMSDLSDMNIAHYQSLAEVRDSAYLVGQPTIWANGMTSSWVKENFPDGIVLGSRSALLLQKDSNVGMVQANPNTIAQEQVKSCEEQIKALGAKITEVSNGPAKTATEAGGDLVAENSLLGSIAGNVEAAMRYALEWCAIFTNEISQDRDAQDNSIKFILNKKFDRMFMSSADRAELVNEKDKGLITFEEARDNLRSSGVRLGDDDKAKKQIEQEAQESLDFETERLKAQASITGKIGGNSQNQSSPTKKAA